VNVREHAMRLVEVALDAVDPARAVHNAVRRQGNVLRVGDQTYGLGAYAHV
jgi:glycerate-2-kinase